MMNIQEIDTDKLEMAASMLKAIAHPVEVGASPTILYMALLVILTLYPMALEAAAVVKLLR